MAYANRIIKFIKKARPDAYAASTAWRHPSAGTNLARYMATKTAPAAETTPYHTIIRQTEKPVGDTKSLEFQAETRKLLDIVARSLYSEKEIFLRELISNASDALEKFRYSVHAMSGNATEFADANRSLEIHIGTEKLKQQLTIQDTGIGMTRQELINNLGTIARSGSKQFLEQARNEGTPQSSTSNIIGQFGVGFYSAFMVADKVEVFTRSSEPDSPGLRWSTEGLGSYEIQEADGVAYGTKIVIHLKSESREYADEDRIRAVIKKYSNFVGSPIYVNGKRANDIQPLWLMNPKDVTMEQHTDFFRYVANTFDAPRFVLHYQTEAPLSIRALLYFPESKPGFFDMTRETEAGVSLYTRKVLIQSKTENLVPKWLRFVKGVVDSEDIPLNLSRELLQNSLLIKKLSNIISARVLRFLHERSIKQPEQYEPFYKDYGLYLKEGIITSQDLQEKEQLAALLRFDSSKTNKRISLEDYSNSVGDQKEIYYLAAPNRELAQASPYFECLQKRDVEVLFCYEPYDELVLMQLGKYKGKNLICVEKAMRQDKDVDIVEDYTVGSLQNTELESLLPWVRTILAGKVVSVKVTKRLDKHPCVITVEEMAAARHFLKTHSNDLPMENRLALLQPQLDINPKHVIIKKLNKLRTTNPQLAELLIQQLFANAMVGAGLAEDPRILLSTMNELLAKALENH